MIEYRYDEMIDAVERAASAIKDEIGNFIPEYFEGIDPYIADGNEGTEISMKIYDGIERFREVDIMNFLVNAPLEYFEFDSSRLIYISILEDAIKRLKEAKVSNQNTL